MKRVLSMLLALAALALPPAAAQSLAVPQAVALPPLAAEAVVLTVAGPAGERQYSLAALEALGTFGVHTSTFWPVDDGHYVGPTLAAVLADAGLGEAAAVRVVAMDGFSQILPRSDWERWPVLLATRRDDQPMRRRDKGPLRIIYPRDMDAALQDTRYRLRWVWLVTRIEAAAP